MTRRLGAVAAVALALLGGSAGPAQAQATSDNLRDYLGPFLDLSLGVRSQVFRVHSPDGPYGEFVSTRVLPGLTIGSPMYTWGGGKYGVNVVWNLASFSMDEQTPPGGDWLAGDKEDVGTSVEGYASYLVPTLNFIADNQKGGLVDAARLGLGVGVGYLRARGDILLNRPEAGSGDEAVADPELRAVDIDDVLPAFTIFMEGRRGPFTLSLSISGPARFGSYETDYLDFSLSLGYSWYRAVRPRPPAPATQGVPAGAPEGTP